MTQIGYNVEVDKAQVSDAVALFEFVGGNSKDALRVAINKAGPKIKTQSSRAIRDQVRLKAKYVNGKLSFNRATRRNLTGRISAESRGVLLTRFATNAAISGEKVTWLKPPPIPKGGIRVKVKPSGSSETMSRNWFLMVLPNSRALAIARRKPKGQTGPRGGKYDIAYGPSVSQVFNKDTRDKLLPKAGEELTKQLLDAMRFLLQKKYPKE